MKFEKKSPPRKFSVGMNKEIFISDCGNIILNHNEQISFLTEDLKEYDIVRKKWGYYATPSINGRLANQGFKTALVKNMNGMRYIMIVEESKIDSFKAYLKKEKNQLVEWLDET